MSKYYFLFLHQWLKFKRSSYWKRDLSFKIIFLLYISFNAFILFFLGLNINKILLKFSPDLHIVQIINKHVLEVLLSIYIFRFFFQKNPVFYILPYLALPVSKSRLIFLLLLRTITNWYIISLLFFFIPLWIKNILPYFSMKGSILWLVGFLLILFLLELIFLLVKSLFLEKPFRTILYTIAVFILWFTSKHLLYFHVNYTFLQTLLNGNVISFAMLLLFSLAVFHLQYRFLLSHFNIDSTNKLRLSSFNSFFHYWPELDRKFPLLTLQIKLILRNRLLRTFLLQGIIGLLFGIILNTLAPQENKNWNLMWIIFFVFFSIGYFYVGAYGQNVFGWDSHYLGAMFTKNISLNDYLKSKIKFMNFSWAIFIIVNLLFFKLLSPCYLLMIASFGLYCAGIISVALIAQAIISFRPIYPNISIIQSMGHTNIKKYILAVAALFPLIVMYLINGNKILLDLHFIYSLSIIGIIGLISLLLQKRMSSFLYKLFTSKKYHFTEDF